MTYHLKPRAWHIVFVNYWLFKGLFHLQDLACSQNKAKVRILRNNICKWVYINVLKTRVSGTPPPRGYSVWTLTVTTVCGRRMAGKRSSVWEKSGSRKVIYRHTYVPVCCSQFSTQKSCNNVVAWFCLQFSFFFLVFTSHLDLRRSFCANRVRQRKTTLSRLKS